jgi:YVTN family beta-propeller protein
VFVDATEARRGPPLPETAIVIDRRLRFVVSPMVWRGVLLVVASAGPLFAQPPATTRHEPRRLPGMSDGGTILLSNQWSLKPAGKQIKLGDLPVQIKLHPKQAWAAVLHAGFGDHEIAIVDLKQERVVSRVTVPQTFYGLCFDSEGQQLFASGGEHEVVHQYKFLDGYLSEHRELRLAGVGETFVPAGVAVSANDKTLYVAGGWGHALAAVPLDDPSASKRVSLGKDSYPYTVLPTPDGKRLFVSLWGKAAVAVIDLESLEVDDTWATESHPTEMALSPNGERLFVACANSNTVSVLDAETGEATETIATALYPKAPNGSTPNSLALSPDGKVLFVANADNNNVAVFNTSESGESRSMGFIPVGWYPTSVRFNPLDKKIYVSNGKGLMSQANAQGPNPLKDPPASVREYIGGLFRGTLSVIESPSPNEMASYSETAYKVSPLKSDFSPAVEPDDADHPIPLKAGGASPIRHCIYIVKENRTYDQVFGDVPEGNGDRHLCLFGEKVTPNHHALAREFVLLDNFYVESEVSADGHEWSMAAYATDFVEKTWPLVYRGGQKKLGYPSEGHFEIAIPAGGYIWDRCREAGVSYRSYGEFIENGKKKGDPAIATLPALEGHFDPQYRGYDLDYLDVKRAERFIEELHGFEQAGEMPQFIVLRLPNDHTFGQRKGKPTPSAMVADNDLALGQLVEAVSKSKFWKDTAIFVVEDDAQNGSDHVDAHRTVALVISSYCKRHYVDSSMYSTSSMLRTMELILGLNPMSQFDAAARPMAASFQTKPDLSPYEHRPAGIDLQARNPASGWGVEQSARLDFSHEDAADDILLNRIIWKSVRGADSRMPPPVRASFVIAREEDDEDEDDD